MLLPQSPLYQSSRWSGCSSRAPGPRSRRTTLIWHGGTDLTGLEAAFVVQGGTGGETAGGETPDGETTTGGETTAGGGGGGDGHPGTTDGGGPGFGLAAALVAIASLALLARRNQ